MKRTKPKPADIADLEPGYCGVGRYVRTPDELRSHLEECCEPVPVSGCWIWTKGTNSAGYGRLSHGSKTWLAHRLMFILSNGKIGEGLLVCHKCDTPACINPEHLFAGTNDDNQKDMVSKGRTYSGSRKWANRRRGESSLHAKLNWDSVGEIRRRHAEGEMQMTLAAEFGVSVGTMSYLIHRKTWVEDNEAG